MNNIKRFKRQDYVEVREAALAITKAIIVNEIGEEELFAALAYLFMGSEES